MAHRRIKNPVLFICDIQDKFRPAIAHFSHVLSTAHKLVRASAVLEMPIVNTTQLRAKLGQPCAELGLELENGGGGAPGRRVLANVDKSAFSMWLPEVVAALDGHFRGGGGGGLLSPSSSSSKGEGEGLKKEEEQDVKSVDGAASAISSVFKNTLAHLAPAKYSIIIVGIETHICVLQTALDALAAGHNVYIVADGVSSCNEYERHVAMHRLRQEGARVTTSESLMYECVGDATDPAFKGIAGIVKDTKDKTKESVDVLCKML